MTRARYSIRRYAPELIALVDEFDEGTPSMSLTNDAEAVIAELVRQNLIGDRRVLYRDSSGVWDEILVKDGRFAGFALIGAHSLEAAAQRIIAARRAEGPDAR